MTFYITNLFLLCICLYILRKRKKIMYLVAFIWLLLLGALRGYGVGADYGAYYNFFEIYSNASWQTSINWGQEIGYVCLNKLVAFLGGDYQTLLAVCSFMVLPGVLLFIKKYSMHPIISLWLYITMIFYQQTFTRLRQAMAISFVLIAYKFAIERRFKPFICLVIFTSICFHRTALIAILIYFLVDNKISQKMMLRIACIVGILIACRSYVSILVTFVSNSLGYGRYQMSEEREGGMQLILYIMILVYIFVCTYRKEKTNNDLYSTRTILFNYAVLAVVFQALATYIPLINRMSGYFALPMMLLLPNTLESFDMKNKKIGFLIMIALSLCFYMYMLSLGASHTVPYSFYWM